MIPKVINYCYFGRKPKSKLTLKCIKSWRKFCPDYEIKEWNEDNFDVNQCLYSQQAYENRQFAFVADYARVKIMEQLGGVYLDTDVELIKSIDDLLKYHSFWGCETPDGGLISVGLGCGAEPNHPLFAQMVRDYEAIPFVKNDGSFDRTTGPLMNTTSYVKITGRQPAITCVKNEEGNLFLPRDYFNPRDFSGFLLHKTKNTRAIHWGASSWMTKEEAKYQHGSGLLKRRIYCMFLIVLGEKTLRKFMHLFGK